METPESRIQVTMTVSQLTWLEAMLGNRLDTLADWLELAVTNPQTEPDKALQLAKQRCMVRDIRSSCRHQLAALAGGYQ